jgi:HlyD family secretion protein
MENRDLSKLKIEKTTEIRKSRRRKIYIYWLSGVAIAAIAAFMAYYYIFATVSVKATTVSLTYPSQELTVLNASGYVVAERKASVAAKTTGRLVWIGVEEGSRVKKGEILAKLENEDVRAAMDQAAANLKVAYDNLKQAKAELDDATLNLKRNKDLLERNFIARSDYDTAFARREKAVGAYGAANSAIAANKAALQSSKVALEYTLIRAPFDAVVLTKNADLGDIITPLGATANVQAAVVTIADLSSQLVEADVSESNIGKVKLKMPCEIQLDAIPEARFMGAVHMIVPTADRSKATVMVKVRFNERDPRVLPEMSAKVAFLSRDIRPGENTPRATVERSAVVSRGGKYFVFVIKGYRAEEAPVELGETASDTVEILKGVKTGDRVVLNPTGRIKNGSRIKIAEG